MTNWSFSISHVCRFVNKQFLQFFPAKRNNACNLESIKCFWSFCPKFLLLETPITRSNFPRQLELPGFNWKEFVWECLRSLLGTKKESQNLYKKKKPHPTFTVHRLLSDRLLCWKEPILASHPFLALLRLLLWVSVQ